MTLEELIEEFDELPDWEDRCDMLIDLGMELPKLAPEEKIEANRVYGCQNNVWVITELQGDAAHPQLAIRANSDGYISGGLVAIVIAMYNGKSPREILDTDFLAIFERLGVSRHLEMQRKNGLGKMVQRVRQDAAAALVQLETGASANPASNPPACGS